MTNKKIGLLTQEQYANAMRQRVQNSGIGSVAGLEQTITTTTQLVAGIVNTLYYKLMGQKLSDFVKIEVGTGAYSTNLVQYASAYVGSPFKQGIINPTASGINADANSNIKIGALNIPNNFWRMKYEATKELVEMARAYEVNFSYFEEQERARLKTYQLGIQKVAFLGTSDGLNEGLLNLSGVTVNTTLLPASFATMTTAQLTNFATTAMSTYFALTNSTVFPNTMVIPTNDLAGLATYISSTYPVGETRKEFLERAFKAAGAPADFKILHTVYNQTAGTSGAPRYVLYNRDADTLTMHLSKPYTPYPLYPVGALDMISDAEAQFTGVWAKRPQEILYMDKV